MDRFDELRRQISRAEDLTDKAYDIAKETQNFHVELKERLVLVEAIILHDESEERPINARSEAAKRKWEERRMKKIEKKGE